MTDKLTELFYCIWKKKAIPHDLKDGSNIYLPLQTERKSSSL